MQVQPTTRLVVVDDHDLVRTQVSRLLAAEGDLQVVGEADDGSSALELVRRSRPQVVVMDYRMRRMSGLEATRRLLLEHPDLRVLILTASLSSGLIADAAAAGAVGVLSKGAEAELLVAAVRRVAAGGTAWPERSA